MVSMAFSPRRERIMAIALSTMDMTIARSSSFVGTGAGG